MDTYTIKKAYPWTSSTEIEITSDNLIYSEIGNTHAGTQTRNMDNNEEIRKRLIKVADLIREIDELNS
jgi:hypothetical protein